MSPFGRRVSIVALVVSLVVSLSVTLGAPWASSAEVPGAPGAPSAVQASVTRQGISVTWAASPEANPPVTHYVVSGGVGSCPVMVPASETSAVLPVMKGQTAVTPTVQAVNELGYSVAGVAPAMSTAGARVDERFKNVQILQLSDFHGAIEKSSTNIGAAALTDAFAADRAAVPSTFTVSSGDNIGAAPAISTQFDEMPTIEAMNLMGFDVSTFGNHEHDRPLAHVRSVIDASEFDWVVSNYSDLKPLKGEENKARPYTLIERADVKIGFVGMNTEQTREQTFPGNLVYGNQEIEISPMASTVQAQVDAAKKEGADIVIALLHQGWSANVGAEPVGRLIDVSRELHGVAAIYGGHSHQTYSAVINGTPVAMVKNSGQEYTRTQLCVDIKKETVVGSSVDYVTKASLGPAASENPAVAAMVAGYRAQLSAKLDVKIGTVSDVFPRGGTPPVERSGQTPLGDIAADALRERYATDFAYVNGGGIRDTFPARSYTPTDPSLRRPAPGSTGPYDVTLGDALSVFPFGNSAATTVITGANLWTALENGVSRWPTDGRFPQISGFHFSFDTSRPVGQRIVSVTKPDGTPIPADQTVYTVSTLDFLVNGGDGYSTLFSPATATIRDLYVDVFTDRIKRDMAAGIVTVRPIADGRTLKVG